VTRRSVEWAPIPPRCPTTQKRSYPDLLTAIRYALRYSLQYGGARRIYQCDHCEYLHLTRRPTWTPRVEIGTTHEPGQIRRDSMHACQLASLTAVRCVA
jgi:hypothetical protein